MKKRIGMAFITLLLLSGSAISQVEEDALIIAARQAVNTGDRVTLERIAANPPRHVLAPYITYWLLLNKLARPDPPPTSDLSDFLSNYSGSLLAERLRGDWIRRLEKDKDWSTLITVYRELNQPELGLTCSYWNAMLNQNDRMPVLQVHENWLDMIDSPPSCTPVFEAAIRTGSVDAEQIWWRFRRQIEGRSPADTQLTLSWLPADTVPTGFNINTLIRQPQRYLEQLPANFSVTRSGREFAMAALVRLARMDTKSAYRHFSRIQEHLNKTERNYVFVNLAHHAALSQRPEALSWFEAAGHTIPTTPEQRAWHVRSALRVQNWEVVHKAIEAMPPDEQAESVWTYWLARAFAARHQQDKARQLYARIADGVDFYGLLAAEELGRPFTLSYQKTTVSEESRNRANNDPSLNRSLAFFRLDMRFEAIREWNWALRNQDDSFLLAASQLALKHDIYDRAINTAEQGPKDANFEMRYLAPFLHLIAPQAHSQGLDLSWVYGIIRQESRFIVPARSSAGAQGLMQVMPATGKWVAKKIGLTNYNPAKLSEPELNVRLGTNYMRIILENLNNNPLLASAGYNAGPGRARRWRDTQPLEGAIYAETIPFNETRDYVKKVAANTVIYAALFEKKPQSIKTRLQTIQPKPAT